MGEVASEKLRTIPVWDTFQFFEILPHILPKYMAAVMEVTGEKSRSILLWDRFQFGIDKIDKRWVPTPEPVIYDC